MPSTRSATTQQMTETGRAHCIELVLTQCAAPKHVVWWLVAGLRNRAVLSFCIKILRGRVAIVAADAWQISLWSELHPDLQRGAVMILQHDLPVVEWLGRSMMHHLKTRNSLHVGHDMCCPFHLNSGWLLSWLHFLAQECPDFVTRSLAENLFVRTGRLVENPEGEEPHMLTVVQKAMPSKIDAPDRPLEELAKLKHGAQRPEGQPVANCHIASHRFDTITLTDKTSFHVGDGSGLCGLADEQVWRWADFWVKVDLMAMLAQLELLQTAEIPNWRRCLLSAAHLAVTAVLGIRKLVQRGMMPDAHHAKQLGEAEERAQERLQLLHGEDHARVQNRCIEETQKVIDQISAGVIDLEMPIGNTKPDGKGPPPVGMVKLKHYAVLNMFKHYNNDGVNAFSQFKDRFVASVASTRPDTDDVLHNLSNLDNRPIACLAQSGGLQGVYNERLRYILDERFMPRLPAYERAQRNWYKYVDKMLIDGFCEAIELRDKPFTGDIQGDATHFLVHLRRALVDLLQKASEDYDLELVCEAGVWDLGDHLSDDEPDKVVRVVYNHDKITERIRNSDCVEGEDTGHIGETDIDKRTRRLKNALNLLGELVNRYNFTAFRGRCYLKDTNDWIHPHNARHGRVTQNVYAYPYPTNADCKNVTIPALLGRMKLFTLPDMNAERSEWYAEPDATDSEPVYSSRHEDIRAFGTVWYCTKWHGGVSLRLNDPSVFVLIAAYMYGNGGMASWMLEDADSAVLQGAKDEQAKIMNLYKGMDIELKPFDLEATIALNTMPQGAAEEIYFAAASKDAVRTLIDAMNGKDRDTF